MIRHVRIDDKLLHGQIAVVWVNALGCNRIMIANDEVVQNNARITALRLACPTGVELSIFSLDQAAKSLLTGRYGPEHIFLIVKGLPDIKALSDAGVGFLSINIGNLPHREGNIQIKKSISLSSADINIIHMLSSKGVQVTAKMLPNEEAADIRTFFP